MLVLLTVILFSYATAQNAAVGLTAGYTGNGIGIDANYNHHLTQESKIQAGVFFSSFTDGFRGEKMTHTIATVNGNYTYTAWSNPRRTLLLGIGAGVVFGFEQVNDGNQELSSGALIIDESQFIYGLNGSVDAEITLATNWSVVAQFTEYYHINSELGNFMPYAGVGLRYFLF